MKLSHFSLVILLVHSVVRAQYTNVTIDDSDNNIFYIGDWSKTQPTPLDYPFSSGSSHALSTSANATATFRFTGVAVYYLSPKWPYLVNSMLSLDGAQGECVDLQDPSRSDGTMETVQSAPVWGKDGLADTEHSVIVSACVNGPYIVVDAFTYSVPDSASVSNSIPTSTPTSTDGSTVQSSSSAVSTGTASKSQSSTTAIAVGGAFGGVVVLAAFVLLFVFCIQRRKQAPEPPRRKRDSPGFLGPSPQMSNIQQIDPFGAAAPNIRPNTNNKLDSNSPWYNSTNTASSLGFYNPSTVDSEGPSFSSISRRPNLPEL